MGIWIPLSPDVAVVLAFTKASVLGSGGGGSDVEVTVKSSMRAFAVEPFNPKPSKRKTTVPAAMTEAGSATPMESYEPSPAGRADPAGKITVENVTPPSVDATSRMFA